MVPSQSLQLNTSSRYETSSYSRIRMWLRNQLSRSRIRDHENRNAALSSCDRLDWLFFYFFFLKFWCREKNGCERNICFNWIPAMFKTNCLDRYIQRNFMPYLRQLCNIFYKATWYNKVIDKDMSYLAVDYSC